MIIFTARRMKQQLRVFFLFITFSLAFSFCGRKNEPEYFYDEAGYYYKLISFEQARGRVNKGQVVKVNVAFRNLADSVFWDSYNNLNDNYYVRLDSLDKHNLFGKCISRFTVNDSVCMLVRPSDLFAQQFNSNEVPYFSRNDTVVKVYFKIKNVLTNEDFLRISHDLEEMELARIEAYYGSRSQVVHAKDSMGFYWVEKPDTLGKQTINEGDLVNITYQGYFLNGRFLERSPKSFDLVFGTPDQLLKGINYVIPYLKVGQSAKIILPSRLAFGEKGSSNGTVPPFTPLAYEIKINEIKPK